MQLVQNRWYAIASSAEVPRGRAIGLTRMGRELALWRDSAGALQAASDLCPHRWARLSGGLVVGDAVECPFHGFQFNGEGRCVRIPAHPERRISGAMSVSTVSVREAHGLVWAWTGPAAPSGEPIPFFDLEGFSWAGSQMAEPVACHYTRAIENQLDFAHLPFVHRNTIGRFLKGAEMDVQTEVEGDRIRARLENDPDGGLLELQGPNVWRLQTGPVWQFLVMAPVDDQRMVYYARTYQPFVTVPGLDWLVGSLQSFFNRVVLRQDTPMVEGQPEGPVRLGSGEVLLPSDAPIIAYRRWRTQQGLVDLPEGRGLPQAQRARSPQVLRGTG